MQGPPASQVNVAGLRSEDFLNWMTENVDERIHKAKERTGLHSEVVTLYGQVLALSSAHGVTSRCT